ncbi:MAG: 2,3-oxidosqualene cyclase [Myxococcales bacterium]|nr:2,3-oxidosqualene cyclase [Myxococcales bacterium]
MTTTTSAAASAAPSATPNDDLHARAADAYARALDHLRAVQQPKGALAGEVIWNPMLICQYVMAMKLLGQPIADDRRRRIRLSLERQVRPDGGWGMHPDSESYLFHTTLAYVALRLLGHPPEDPLAAAALRWIHNHGGPLVLPTWGRIWLALLGLYPWESVQAIVPEIWLLPEASPFHPRRLYCHMRLIYLGLSFVYGSRLQADEDGLLRAIRDELYPEGYAAAPFERYRDTIAVTDLYEAPGVGLRTAFAGLRLVDRLSPKLLRRRALDRAFDQILFELRSTAYVCLSPVNGLLFTLALFARDRRHPELPAAIRGLEYWVWEDEVDGMRIAGARSDIWDTAFALQALAEGPRSETAAAIAEDACRWLPTAQMRADVPDGARHFRSPAAGGWGFADEHHPWPVSDCTAEAMEGLLRAADAGLVEGPGLPKDRALAAIRFVLGRQNDDGGFGSYEARRGSMVIRHFNPAEIYGNCMLEYSYAECTASCVRGLAYARDRLGDALPRGLAREVEGAIERGVAFLLKAQDAGGGWAGFWGVNFTYGTFFVAGALRACGLDPHHPALRRACRWLCRAQRPDGGWGEDFRGVLDGSDVRLPPEEPSLVTQSAWALLALMAAAPAEDADAARAIERGIAFVSGRQGPDGAWPRERASGVFFNTAVLDYDLYRQIFPAWALARYLGEHSAEG